jgi:hypothetical protein
MATPTDQQQIRATLRRHERNEGSGAAARLAIGAAVDIVGMACVVDAATGLLVFDPTPAMPEITSALPPLLGAAEAADVLGMKATNLKRLSPPLPVAAVISGRIPVYREADVLAAKARRDARRAAWEADVLAAKARHARRAT